MSAYIVDDRTTAVVALWASMESGRADLKRAQTHASMIRALNVVSVDVRYNEETSAAEAAMVVSAQDLMAFQRNAPVAVLKAIQCLEYQSCEFEGWKNSEGYRSLQRAKDNAIRALDGYNEAGWGQLA